jgi:hypothetical protein
MGFSRKSRGRRAGSGALARLAALGSVRHYRITMTAVLRSERGAGAPLVMAQYSICAAWYITLR